ncbi:MAG: peptide/nickel transport system substrate-binding protein [Candidatus Parcubacteria bacterium]|nr:peptide/nickel transport system substrate-binding protein [Candidatus Parcubacteria bacterium]
MSLNESSKEFSFKQSLTILDYIRRFSATEKGVFGILVLIAALSALIMAGSVNAYFMTEVPAHGDNLKEGVAGLPRSINPTLAISDVDRDISSLVYSGLIKWSGGELVPDLAKSYEVSADGLTYTFTLRDNLRFQDGHPLTAEDVVFTVQKIQDAALKSPRRNDWTNVTAKEISASVVEFILKQPYSPFLTNTTVGILPKHIWNGIGDDQFIFSAYNTEPVGSGPYKKNGEVRGTSGIPTEYKLSTWRGYYGTVPHLSNITFYFFADEAKALSALDAGTIDSVASVGSADAARLASDRGEAYTVLSAPLPRIFGVFFNQNQASVLADKNVRAALDMAVDRSLIVATALDGYGLPIHGPLPVGVGGTMTAGTASAGTTTDDGADIAGARALLEKNGWKKDPASGIYQFQKKGAKSAVALAFDIYTADTPDLKQAAELVKNSWNALGAEVEVKIFDPGDLYQNIIRTRKYDALLFGEFIGKDRDLFAFWHSSERNAPGLNVAMYANSKADKLLEDIRTTGDEAARLAKYKQFSSLIAADIPAVFLYVPDFTYAVPKAMHNVELGAVVVPSDRFNSLADWYRSTEKVWKIFTKN